MKEFETMLTWSDEFERALSAFTPQYVRIHATF